LCDDELGPKPDRGIGFVNLSPTDPVFVAAGDFKAIKKIPDWLLQTALRPPGPVPFPLLWFFLEELLHVDASQDTVPYCHGK
jgi:hypothetical protein